jgi:hypothetical protein
MPSGPRAKAGANVLDLRRVASVSRVVAESVE